MTVFISEEGHIFQAFVSASSDRHIVFDGRLGRTSGSDIQYIFQKGNEGNLVCRQLTLTSRYCVLTCSSEWWVMSGGFQHGNTNKFFFKVHSRPVVPMVGSGPSMGLQESCLGS